MTRKALRFAALGGVAYLATLVATVPADIVLPRSPIVTRLDGTLWHGEALLAGGNRISWRWAPLRSLATLGFAADWNAVGPGTDLGGRALLRPGAMRIDDMAGRADGTFLAALAPDLPFTCDIRFSVSLPRIMAGMDRPGATGEILTDAGTCQNKASGLASMVAPLAIGAVQSSAGSRITIVPQAHRRVRLADAMIDIGRLDLSITPAGARALPFLAPAGALTMSFDL